GAGRPGGGPVGGGRAQATGGWVGPLSGCPVRGRFAVPDRHKDWQGAGICPADSARDGRIMTAPYLVIGAGPTGLGCAAELVKVHPVELIDRIPVPGGEAGWSTPELTARVADARRRGVRFRLGTTAVRWEPGRLLVAGPGKIEWLPGERLFYAGGLRPATAADLFITGDRPAGVLPATVAHHLLAAQNRLWD